MMMQAGYAQREFYELLGGYFAGSLTPHDLARLNEVLRRDDELVRQFHLIGVVATGAHDLQMIREGADKAIAEPLVNKLDSDSIAGSESAEFEAPETPAADADRPLPIYLPGCEPKPSKRRD